MKKLSLSIILILVTISFARAQREVNENSEFLDRIYTGGGLQLSFGNNTTIVGASPILGYMITPKLSAGLGVTYLYYKFRSVNLSTSVYGGKIFARYNVFNPVILYSEYELLSFNFAILDSQGVRETVPALNVGGGISQPIGGVAGIQIIFLYDLLHDRARSVTPSPFSIRGGLTIGF